METAWVLETRAIIAKGQSREAGSSSDVVTATASAVVGDASMPSAVPSTAAATAEESRADGGDFFSDDLDFDSGGGGGVGGGLPVESFFAKEDADDLGLGLKPASIADEAASTIAAVYRGHRQRWQKQKGGGSRDSADDQDDTGAAALIYGVGTRVDCRFAGLDEWYRGVIAHLHEDGTYDIHYDDGDRETGA
jgi:hypothetical protein